MFELTVEIMPLSRAKARSLSRAILPRVETRYPRTKVRGFHRKPARGLFLPVTLTIQECHPERGACAESKDPYTVPDLNCSHKAFLPSCR